MINFRKKALPLAADLDAGILQTQGPILGAAARQSAQIAANATLHFVSRKNLTHTHPLTKLAPLCRGGSSQRGIPASSRRQ